MTMEQAEQKMECLREVFSIVRLVDGEMLEKRAEHSPGCRCNGDVSVLFILE